jgi:hypothetical protein
LKTPNAATQAAMEQSRAIVTAKRTRFRKGQDLIDDLDEKAR